MTSGIPPAVWFPTIRAHSGADNFTVRLAAGLRQKGFRAEITWLPHRAEYAPWSFPVPQAPPWANIAVVNTWLPSRFFPTRLPVVAVEHLCVHDPILYPYKSPFQRIYHAEYVHKLESRTIDRARKVIAVSHYTAERTKEAFNVTDVEVIHNGIALDGPFQPNSKRYPHHPFRLLYVGNWSKRKGTDLLGPVMRTLGPQYELYYTSDRDISLPENTFPLGRLNTSNHLAHAYRNADALLFPTRMEGMPLAVLEAQASGLPVISTNCSSLPEVIAHGENGLLCKQDDISAFSAAVHYIANDTTRWRRISKAGRNRMQRLFDLTRMVDNYLVLFSRLL